MPVRRPYLIAVTIVVLVIAVLVKWPDHTEPVSTSDVSLNSSSIPLALIEPAVEVERHDEPQLFSVWLIDRLSGQRVQHLYTGTSHSLRPELSPDHNWIIVSDSFLSNLYTVHLFQRSGATSYQQIEHDSFPGVLWDKFTAEILDQTIDYTHYQIQFIGWEENSVRLRLSARSALDDVAWVSKEYTVELPIL